jgi:hypothetical protein
LDCLYLYLTANLTLHFPNDFLQMIFFLNTAAISAPLFVNPRLETKSIFYQPLLLFLFAEDPSGSCNAKSHQPLFTNDGHLHQQMVVLGTTTDYTNNVFFKQHSASEIPQIGATANSKVEIFSNDFMDFDFDVAINGTTQSAITDNFFAAQSAGNQFESTGINSNQTLCNRYQGNIVGTNIVGKNTGFLFRQEDFATDKHDLFIEGPDSNPGQIPMLQGTLGGARWNSFSIGKPENIKTSTVAPNDSTIHFIYFHPDPANDPTAKPKCSLNDACVPHSFFTNVKTGGGIYSGCTFPAQSPLTPCVTKPCLDAVRAQIIQKTAQYSANPTTQLAAELQDLVTQREYITSDLVRGYVALNNWATVETLLNEDLNPANRRRMVGAKLEQKQFTASNSLLQNFPQSNLDDQYFVQVQNINSARLSNPNMERYMFLQTLSAMF